MVPHLALFLCIAAVIFLLKIEARQSPDVTKGLWIPTIWVLYVASRPLARWFQVSSADPEAGSSLDRIFLTILTLFALWILFKRKFDWSSAIRDNFWLMVLVSLMLISILWSDIPGVSFKRWVREIQAVLIAFVVYSEPSPRHAIESIFRRTAYILLPISIILIKYFPHYGVEFGRWSGAQMWTGVATQKNGLGRLCMIVAFFLIWTLIRRWQGKNPAVWKYQTYADLAILALAFWLLKGPGRSSYSATSIIALLLGLIVYATFLYFKNHGKIIGIRPLRATILFFIFYGVFTVYTGEIRFTAVTSAAGRNVTLTDRTIVWAQLLPVAIQKPILGRGFGGFWTPITREEFRISGAHSGYLDVFLGLGSIGILILSVWILSCLKKAHRGLNIDFEWGIFGIAFIIMVVTHNIAESSINSLANHLTSVILFLSVSSPRIFSKENPTAIFSD